MKSICVFMCYLLLYVNCINFELLMKYNKKEQLSLTKRIKEVNQNIKEVVPKTKREIAKIEQYKENLKTLNNQIIELKKQMLYLNQKITKINKISQAIDNQDNIIHSISSKLTKKEEQNQHGVIVNFYNDELFNTKVQTKEYSTINFEFNQYELPSNISIDNFSIDIMCYLRSPLSGYYTFQIQSDIGNSIEFYINDNKVNNNTIHLHANNFNKIYIRYFHSIHYDVNSKDSVLKLLWKNERENSFTLIPNTFLYKEIDKEKILYVSTTLNQLQIHSIPMMINNEYALIDLPRKYHHMKMIIVNQEDIDINKGNVSFSVNVNVIVHLALQSDINFEDFEMNYDMISIVNMNQYNLVNDNLITNNTLISFNVYQKEYDAGEISIHLPKVDYPILLFFEYNNKSREEFNRSDINLRCRDNLINNEQLNGLILNEDIIVNCIESCVNEEYEIFGGDKNEYSLDSSVCRSAYHSGAIGREGGKIVLKKKERNGKIKGIEKNGIISKNKKYVKYIMAIIAFNEFD